MEHLTSICRIGTVKWTGDEWSSYTKHFDLAVLPESAAIRVDSQGVCGIYLNGEFIEASAGRFFGRITYVEVTSKLKIGQNELKLVLGSHFLKDRRKRPTTAAAHGSRRWPQCWK